jgi:hypothetical protein
MDGDSPRHADAGEGDGREDLVGHECARPPNHSPGSEWPARGISEYRCHPQGLIDSTRRLTVTGRDQQPLAHPSPVTRQVQFIRSRPSNSPTRDCQRFPGRITPPRAKAWVGCPMPSTPTAPGRRPSASSSVELSPWVEKCANNPSISGFPSNYFEPSQVDCSTNRNRSISNL